MAELKLKTVTRTQGNNRALKDGTVKPKTFEFDFEEVDPIIAAFRRMVRGQRVRHLRDGDHHLHLRQGARQADDRRSRCSSCARSTTAPSWSTAKAGISTPKDLEGKRVGVNRGYTVTTGVWARGVLQDEHGVDLEQGHLGAVRRRARRRIQAARECGADRARQEDGGHAGLGRACRRHRRRRRNRPT